MPYIKKLVFDGFKSFAQEVEIPFEHGMNVIVGPNGSGKSNVVDGICFVLGRLSMKSIRADKSTGLIFSGSKTKKAASEASVKLVFDNSDNGFSIEDREIIIERIVRENGQGIYKINSEIKTRQEIIEMLASAGIDPHGFNIVLQGEISSFAQMHPEERRKVIEEVAGISVYEARKEKSLHELDKTDEKLREVGAILRERTSYLKNLEEERQEALKYKNAEEILKRCKASLIHKDLEEKKKEIADLSRNLEQEQKVKEKIRAGLENLQQEIKSMEDKINEINEHIQTSSGIEQEKLHEDITNLKASLAGLTVRKENLENRLAEIIRRRDELTKSIQDYEKEIEELKKKSPIVAKKQEELRKKKEEFSRIEEKRKKLYSMEHELASLRERIKDKQRSIERIKNESDLTIKHIELLSKGVSEHSFDACKSNITKIQEDIAGLRKGIDGISGSRLEYEKSISVFFAEIKRLEKIKQDVAKLDICPLCQSKISESHIEHVISDSDGKIKTFEKEIENASKNIEILENQKIDALSKIHGFEELLQGKQAELLKLQNIDSKKDYLKKLVADQASADKDIVDWEKKKKTYEAEIRTIEEVEESYDKIMLEIQEISAMNEGNVDTSIMYKERELDNIKNIIKRSLKDEENIIRDRDNVAGELSAKTEILAKREKEDEELARKFRKLFDDRFKIQQEMHEKNNSLIVIQQDLRSSEDKINNFKIEKARHDAELESLQIEFQQYNGIELLQGSRDHLKERLQKSEYIMAGVGSVNLRALEVYDTVKQEYDAVQERVKKLEEEKVQIIKVIEEIDRKKKRTFTKTLEDINVIFTRNFMQLSIKGEAFLEAENNEDPFSAGLNIIIKVGKGKYFDVTSLSGGEQTLVALSLIFAIQEYKPYSFYLFDEIDAALDKRNSEKLAALVKRYIKSGQYIIITHNDAIITEASTLYGVTMQEGISKVVSLKL